MESVDSGTDHMKYMLDSPTVTPSRVRTRPTCFTLSVIVGSCSGDLGVIRVELLDLNFVTSGMMIVHTVVYICIFKYHSLDPS